MSPPNHPPPPHTHPPRQGTPGDRKAGFKNRLQGVSAPPLASGASVCPSVKWVDGPCSSQSSRRCGAEKGVKTHGEAPALCPGEPGAMQGPRGKCWGGDLVTTDVTCRERPTCLLFLSPQTVGVRSVRPQHTQPSGGLWEPHSPGSPSPVLPWSPRPRPRPRQLRTERSEPAF